MQSYILLKCWSVLQQSKNHSNMFNYILFPNQIKMTFTPINKLLNHDPWFMRCAHGSSNGQSILDWKRHHPSHLFVTPLANNKQVYGSKCVQYEHWNWWNIDTHSIQQERKRNRSFFIFVMICDIFYSSRTHGLLLLTQHLTNSFFSGVLKIAQQYVYFHFISFKSFPS